MSNEERFKNILAQYCSVPAEEMTSEMKIRDDLELSSLDFMSFLGELEDEFDVELDEQEVLKLTTIGDALEYMDGLLAEA